jgi:hypothetical protein
MERPTDLNQTPDTISDQTPASQETAITSTKPTTTAISTRLLPADTWTPEEDALVRVKFAKPEKFYNFEHAYKLYKAACTIYRLNPLAGEIDMIPYNGMPTFQVGIQGLRLLGRRTGNWGGVKNHRLLVQDKDGVLTTVKYELYSEVHHPVLISATVDITHKETGTASYTAPLNYFINPNNKLWEKMPAHMLLKCAEAVAIRAEFWSDLRRKLEETHGFAPDLYIDGELHTDVVDVEFDSVPKQQTQKKRTKKTKKPVPDPDQTTDASPTETIADLLEKVKKFYIDTCKMKPENWPEAIKFLCAMFERSGPDEFTQDEYAAIRNYCLKEFKADLESEGLL